MVGSTEVTMKRKIFQRKLFFRCFADVLLSSAGWVGLNIPINVETDFRIWTPEARGIFIRQPSLIPYGGNLRGDRIRGTLAYRTELPFVKPR